MEKDNYNYPVRKHKRSKRIFWKYLVECDTVISSDFHNNNRSNDENKSQNILYHEGS